MAPSHSAWAPSASRSILLLAAFLSIMLSPCRNWLAEVPCVPLQGAFEPRLLKRIRFLSRERHRRSAAQRKPLLRGQDDRRMRRLNPPEFRGHPLIDGLLYGRRLYHQLAGVNKLGQLLLLLQSRLQLDRSHPVEGGPNGAPLAALFLYEPPELISSCSCQGFFLRSHEQPPLPLQAPGFEAVLF